MQYEDMVYGVADEMLEKIANDEYDYEDEYGYEDEYDYEDGYYDEDDYYDEEDIEAMAYDMYLDEMERLAEEDSKMSRAKALAEEAYGDLHPAARAALAAGAGAGAAYAGYRGGKALKGGYRSAKAALAERGLKERVKGAPGWAKEKVKGVPGYVKGAPSKMWHAPLHKKMMAGGAALGGGGIAAYDAMARRQAEKEAYEMYLDEMERLAADEAKISLLQKAKNKYNDMGKWQKRGLKYGVPAALVAGAGGGAYALHRRRQAEKEAYEMYLDEMERIAAAPFSNEEFLRGLNLEPKGPLDYTRMADIAEPVKKIDSFTRSGKKITVPPTPAAPVAKNPSFLAKHGKKLGIGAAGLGLAGAAGAYALKRRRAAQAEKEAYELFEEAQLYKQAAEETWDEAQAIQDAAELVYDYLEY